MKLIPFLDKLYAFKYDGERSDEFARAFEVWSDNEYLKDFFEKNIEDLNGGFYNISSTDVAVMMTLSESYEFQEVIMEAIEKNDLEKLFKSLDNKEFRHVSLSKKKAYGTRHKSWLRIYALHVNGIFLITRKCN